MLPRPIKMSEEDIKFHRDADREIQFMEDLEKWLPGRMDRLSDPDLAAAVEAEFGIPSATTLACFTQGRGDETTHESICKARQLSKLPDIKTYVVQWILCGEDGINFQIIATDRDLSKWHGVNVAKAKASVANAITEYFDDNPHFASDSDAMARLGEGCPLVTIIDLGNRRG